MPQASLRDVILTAKDCQSAHGMLHITSLAQGAAVMATYCAAQDEKRCPAKQLITARLWAGCMPCRLTGYCSVVEQSSTRPLGS